MYRSTFAEIDLNSLRHNYHQIKQSLNQGHFICPMVKSNAYGHGDKEVAAVLSQEGAQHLGVALVEEALRIKGSLIETDLLVFGGFTPKSLKICEEHNFIPVISRWEDLNIIISEKLDVRFHLKFNSGMNRLGFEIWDTEELVSTVKKNSKLRLEGLCTHLATAEDFKKEKSTSLTQLKHFQLLSKEFENYSSLHLHAMNSSAFENVLLASKDSEFSQLGVRPGIFIYGGQKCSGLDLKPVMNLKSQIIQLHKLKEGEKVSYGGTWVAEKESLIGVLPIGYADGYPRGLSNKARVLVADQWAPVIGAVCMDYTMIDLTNISESSPLHKEVSLWGQNVENSVESVAQVHNTISYELLACVGIRVPRVFV